MSNGFILLLYDDLGPLKVIDFGSSCYEGASLYSYVQSRCHFLLPPLPLILLLPLLLPQVLPSPRGDPGGPLHLCHRHVVPGLHSHGAAHWPPSAAGGGGAGPGTSTHYNCLSLLFLYVLPPPDGPVYGAARPPSIPAHQQGKKEPQVLHIRGSAKVLVLKVIGTAQPAGPVDLDYY